MYYWWHFQQPAKKRFGTPKNGPIYTCSWISAPPPGNGFHLLLKDPPGSDEPAAPNNGNVLIIFLIYLASSGCFFKSTSSSSIILINPVLANSKWLVCRKVVAKHSINCRLMIVIIGTHNTDVLSTKAVNDLVMILYHDACYAHRSSSSKGFHHKCSYQYRSGGTCCSHTEWTRLLGMCPFLSTLLFLILDPNHQEHFHWYMPWTGCDTTSSFHGKMKKSCSTCNQCICHFDGLHI